MSPPFRKVVRVRRITVGGFLDLLRTIAPRIAQAMVKAGAALDDRQFIASWADAEVVAAGADLVCVDQPAGFLQDWLHGRLGGFFARRNTDRLLRACRQVEGDGQWTRFLGCINRNPQEKKPKGQGGGLMADVLMLSGMLHLPPMSLMEMPLQDFLNLCDSLNTAAEYERRLDPTMDPDAEAAPAESFQGFAVH